MARKKSLEDENEEILWFEIVDEKQSRKKPVSASAMLTGKFLQIRKVFCDKFIIG